MRLSTNFECQVDGKQQMIRHGYCHVRGTAITWAMAMWFDWESIKEQFDKLPLDPYGESANRRRQLGRFTLVPYAGLLFERPASAACYAQSVKHNREVGGIVRRFEPLPGAIMKNRFLHKLIAFDFKNSLFPKSIDTPVDVGVHFIRLFAEPDKPGIGVPDCLHKDGEPFTYIHLVNRVNVVGGESVVTDNDKHLLLETTLSEPMDTVGVDDKSVFHQVKRVECAPGATKGYRDVILVDFTPMIANPIG